MTKPLSRREILYCAGGLLAATTAKAQTPAISPIMTRLSTFMSAAAAANLPADVVEKTKHMILDTLAAMISGSELPPGRFAINFARAYKGDRKIGRFEPALPKTGANQKSCCRGPLLTLLLAGIHNAWDAVSYQVFVIRKPSGED